MARRAQIGRSCRAYHRQIWYDVFEANRDIVNHTY